MHSSSILRIAVAVVFIGAILGIGVSISLTSRHQPASSAGPTSAQTSARAESPRFAPANDPGFSYIGPTYSGPFVSPTREKSQSKLWHVDGQWWGLLLGRSGAYTVHRLNWRDQTWQDTGTFVDERPKARADVLWDGAHLYIISAERDSTNPTNALRLSRFSPIDGHAGYAIDPGYPIELTEGGVISPTIAKDSTGRLWIAFQTGDSVQMAHSLENDRAWSTPMDLSAAGATPLDEVESVAIAAYATRVGVLWSNQIEDAFYFSSRADSASPDEWSDGTRVFEGASAADDHVSVKVASDRVFAVIKTSFNDLEDRQPQSAGTVVLAMAPNGDWSHHIVARVQDRHTQPIMVIDDALAQVHVFAADALGGTVYRKTASLETLEFAEGVGDAFISSAEHDATNTPTSTKQAVSRSSGLVILSFDPETQNYLHGSMALGGVAPGTGPPPPPLTQLPMVSLFDDRFDTVPAGEPPGNGWTLSEGGMLLTASDGADTVGSATLTAPPGSVEARACKNVPRTAAGRLSIDMSVRLASPIGSSVEIASVRGVGREMISARLAPGGAVTYFDGAGIQIVPGVHQPGSWYRSRLTVDLDSRTYGWELVDITTGSTVFTLASAAWLPTESTEVDKLCLELSDESLTSLQFDDILVTRLSE